MLRSEPTARSKLLRAFLVLVAALALTATNAGAATSPYKQPGMWVWYVSQTEGGDPVKIATRAARYKVKTVFIKSGDGPNYWSQFDSIVGPLKQLGLRVCAWQFVYGSKPQAEADVAARAVQAGADCFVIDAEGQYENKYTAASQYITRLRGRIGLDYPVALTSFAYPDFHPSVPYSVFLGPGGAQWNMPQMYFKAFGSPIPKVFAHTWQYNQIYGRPISPLGQTYEGVRAKQVIEFRKYARFYRSRGYSWWEWHFTRKDAWKALRRKLRPSRARAAAPAYPVYKQGAKGDIIRFAKMKLNASGATLELNNTFDAVMTTALQNFQSSKGLTVTGQLDAATWPVLLAVQIPVPDIPRIVRVGAAGPTAAVTR
ncbi:MAG: peptidoglycan-binding domain-containing protein [Solirubrobacterales bacterium]